MELKKINENEQIKKKGKEKKANRRTINKWLKTILLQYQPNGDCQLTHLNKKWTTVQND